MNKKENFADLTPNGRYYANPIEQQILVQGLQRYFSLPERSQNRNKIAKEVSTYLRRFSLHWSHRAVRLWFNNNKHTYIGQSNEEMQEMNPNIIMNYNPNMNINPNANLSPNMNLNPNINLNPNMNMNANININPNINMSINTNINMNANVNPNMSMNMGMGIPNKPIIAPQIQKPPTQSIIAPPQLKQVPSFHAPIQSPNNKPPTPPQPQFPKANNIPMPFQNSRKDIEVNKQKNQDKNKNNTKVDEKSIKIPQQQIKSDELSKTQTSPTQPLINNTARTTTYPLINSPVYHSSRIPSPQIITETATQNQENTTNKNHPLPAPQQTLPAPQIIPKINSTMNSRSPIQISSPIQVVSPRQTPEKIPLTLPPIKVSEISPSSNNKLSINNSINISNNSSRNISASPSIEGKNIVSSPITSQKYVMRPPIQVGSKVLFPPIQLEEDYNMTNINNISSPAHSSTSLSMEPSIDQSYANLARLLKNIQDTDEKDPQLGQKISEFDNSINSLKSRCYNIEVDRIEPRLKSTRFPFSREPSTDFNLWNQIPESNSNLDILSEFPMRSPSFSHQFFYATENASVSHGDSFAISNIWQTRNYTDKKVPYFECSTFGDDIAAYVHLQLQNQNQRVLSFYNYRTSHETKNYSNSQNSADFYNINNLNNNFNDNKNTNNNSRAIDQQWGNIIIDCSSRVEAMSINKNYAWLLADRLAIRASLVQDSNSETVKIPSQNGCICAYKDYMSVVASSSSGILTVISENLELAQIQTSYRGITNVYSMDDAMLLTVPLSCMPRLIDSNGKEIRAFLGHCANVQGIALLSPLTFASRADDYTVRIWDMRQREASMAITTLHNSVINIAGSSNFVVTAFHNKIGVIDIRGNTAKPILGVTTEDYDAASLKYSQQDDYLAMFGVIEKENNKDSMLFVGGDGQSRQRIFRIYSDFVGIQNE